MSLFVINRYDGENIENEGENEEKSTLLSKLLKKAEKRKRARERQKVEKAFQPPKPKQPKLEQPIETKAEPEPLEEKQEEPTTEIPSTTDFEFQVIGTDKFTKKSKVSRVLPSWLSNPTKISSGLTELKTRIEDLTEIDPEFRKVLQNEGFTHYFPIQAAILPHFIRELNKPVPFWPRDICISAATGSGKTLTYVLPIVQALKDRVVRKIRALIVVPVKELAVQVAEVFKKYTKLTDLKLTLLAGTVPFEQEQLKIVRKAENGVYVFESDIIVTTPGRLVDHLHMTPGLSMCDLRFLVLDEADRMMDREQNDWIYHLEQHMRRQNGTFRINHLNLSTLMSSKRPPQKILASATLTHDPEKLYRIGLFKPRLFVSTTDEEPTKFVIPNELKLQYFVTTSEQKVLAVNHLIRNVKKVLCFTGSGVETHRLALLLKHLAPKVKVAELSAQLSDRMRNLVIKQFAEGDVNILVSTDALARGLDVPDVECVISYNVPNNVQTYVHRVGRTARAGKSGKAIALVTQAQKKSFLKMCAEYADKLEDITMELKDDGDRYVKAINALKKDLVHEKELGIKKIKQIKKKKN